MIEEDLPAHTAPSRKIFGNTPDHRYRGYHQPIWNIRHISDIGIHLYIPGKLDAPCKKVRLACPCLPGKFFLLERRLTNPKQGSVNIRI